MLEMIFNDVLFNTLGGLSAFFIILDVTMHFGLDPTNSTVGMQAASSLNLPVTFSFVLS